MDSFQVQPGFNVIIRSPEAAGVGGSLVSSKVNLDQEWIFSAHYSLGY